MKVARLAPLLALVAVSGYLFGGCGSGNGSPGVSGAIPSGALPEVTATRPEVTVPTIPTVPQIPTLPTLPTPTGTTGPETTTEVATTTVVETETAASPPTPSESTSPTDTGPSESVAVAPASSESNTPWGWIVLALGLLAAGVTVGIVTWRRRRSGGAS
jgi:hypothetical protein